MKAYITKFALTQGIALVEGYQKGKDFVVQRNGSEILVTKGHWCPDEASAIARVVRMLSKRKASVMRQLKNLETLESKATAIHEGIR